MPWHAWFGAAVVAVVVVVLGCKLWNKCTMGMCRSTRSLSGCTVLVTGANTGIGLETAKDLARRGARVLLACRDPQRGRKALEEVRAAAGAGASADLLQLDLSSLASVRSCAAQILATESRLDVLINNAGAGGLGSDRSVDGLHLGFQVNHFGPFLFTLLVLPLVKKSAPARIIFVSSLLHYFTSLKPHELEYEHAKDIADPAIYSKSKLANVIVANELARRLSGTGVTCNSLHPGLVRTEFFRNVTSWKAFVVNSFASLFCKNAVEGAQTTIHLAVSEEVEGVSGRFYCDCKAVWMRRQDYKEDLGRSVWEKSEQLVTENTRTSSHPSSPLSKTSLP